MIAFDAELNAAQGDAIRYFVLHKYGGVYLDMDVECFRNMEHTLLDADLVLQVFIVSFLVDSSPPQPLQLMLGRFVRAALDE